MPLTDSYRSRWETIEKSNSSGDDSCQQDKPSRQETVSLIVVLVRLCFSRSNLVSRFQSRSISIKVKFQNLIFLTIKNT